ncbi:hypothetical protein Tcan_03917 [Toxocara canis]|uniref:Uncharacterized protein n=1 Tax=Toxocara canis TaxID=6265 RepID=A0A0B2VZ56_TOXCA|nr:hypothetical protein Tcan_03917 [Toxocara canis]
MRLCAGDKRRRKDRFRPMTHPANACFDSPRLGYSSALQQQFQQQHPVMTAPSKMSPTQCLHFKEALTPLQYTTLPPYHASLGRGGSRRRQNASVSIFGISVYFVGQVRQKVILSFLTTARSRPLPQRLRFAHLRLNNYCTATSSWAVIGSKHATTTTSQRGSRMLVEKYPSYSSTKALQENSTFTEHGNLNSSSLTTHYNIPIPSLVLKLNYFLHLPARRTAAFAGIRAIIRKRCDPSNGLKMLS